MQDYITDEQRVQARLKELPTDPDDYSDPQEIVQAQAAPPAYFWIECPQCGGVLTVFSPTARGRIAAGIPVGMDSASFVNRQGERYIPYQASIDQVHCVDCNANLHKLQQQYGPLLAATGPRFHTTDALPPKKETTE